MIVTTNQDETLFVLKDVPLRLNQVVGAIMGARHVLRTDDWTVPATWPGLCQIISDLKTCGIEPDERARDLSRRVTEQVSHVYETQVAQDFEGNSWLFPLQRTAVEYLDRQPRGILAYDMGGGKTVIVCDELNQLKAEAQAILIACPKGVMSVWESHLHRWTSDVTPIVASDTSAKRKKAIDEAKKLIGAGRRVALIMNYESVWRYTRLSPYGNLRMEKCAECAPDELDPTTKARCETCLKELNEIHWDTVVCDEAHRVINVSKQTRGLWYLSREADRVWACTGTPTRGSTLDFWSLLRLVDPVSWPSRGKYADRYCSTVTDNWGNTVVLGVRQDTKAELDKMTAPYMIRRSFNEILESRARAEGRDHVPIEVLQQQRFVEMTREQRRMYDELTDKIFTVTPDGRTVYADNGLTLLTRQLQLVSSMVEVDEDTGQVRMVGPSPKVKELLQLVDDLNGEPLTVFTVNRDMVTMAADELEKRGVRTAVLHGGVDPDARDIEIERFQRGDAQVFLSTFAAGSEGITLTRARVRARMQLSWSMIFNQQADRRVLRIGQEASSVLFVDLITEDTVESRVYEAYGDKLDALEEIVKDAKRMKELITGAK